MNRRTRIAVLLAEYEQISKDFDPHLRRAYLSDPESCMNELVDAAEVAVEDASDTASMLIAIGVAVTMQKFAEWEAEL